MTNTPNLPRETDTALAARYHELADVDQRIAWNVQSILHYAGARYYYRGRQRVTDTKLADALPMVEAEVARMEAHEAANTVDGQWRSGIWLSWEGPIAPYDLSNAQQALVKRVELEAERQSILAAIAELESRWTGWSRFFLVTSSSGHVHRSMACSTCRPTTTFGWLPELSGQTEAQAVAELGPALCSVCFPSAPVEHQGGKLTAAQARKRAA
jgi:hypothetical protein